MSVCVVALKEYKLPLLDFAHTTAVYEIFSFELRYSLPRYHGT